jgi:hypothetical protein
LAQRSRGPADAAEPDRAGLLERRADLLEHGLPGTHVGPGHPGAAAVGPAHPGAERGTRGVLLAPLGQVQRGVVVVAAAQQQHPAAQPVQGAERGALAQRVVEGVPGHDLPGAAAERGEGDLGMVAAQRPRPGAHRLGYGTHPAARGGLWVERRGVLADHRPPRPGYRRVPPRGRVAVVRGVGGYDHRAPGADRREQRADHCLDPAGHEPQAAHRGVHEQDVPVGHAEGAKVCRE